MLDFWHRLGPLAVALSLAGAAQAQVTQICAGGDIVEAPEAGLATRVCDVLDRALPQLAACHLPRETVLTITINDDFAGEHPGCMGVYDCESDQVQVLPPDALASLFLPESIYRRIDVKLMFDSLIVHEITHALVYQVMGPDSGPRAQNEYMAYAMQYAFLPDAARQRLLEDRKPWSEVTLDSLNGLVLAMAPDAFAARVWTHFSQPEHGCEMFRRILSREIEIGEGPHP